MNRLPGLVLRMECTELDAIFEWVLPFTFGTLSGFRKKLLIRVFGIFSARHENGAKEKSPPLAI